jgi:tellurite resistance protein TehA-like permease
LSYCQIQYHLYSLIGTNFLQIAPKPALVAAVVPLHWNAPFPSWLLDVVVVVVISDSLSVIVE